MKVESKSRLGGKRKKVIKLLSETMNESPKKHLHIPQSKKGIYVLNIVVQNILEKRRCGGNGSQGNIQNPNAPDDDTKTRWK
jgi:hypothetical protein